MRRKVCPHCTTAFLTPTRYQDTDIELCQTCGGLWFEKQALNELLAEQTADAGMDYTQRLGNKVGPTDLKCPDCRGVLKHYHLLQDFTLEVDVCAKCEGVWVEHDEVEALQHSPRLQGALAPVNKKTHAGTWLFQFFSHLPVEYNIPPHRTPWVTWALMLLNVLIFASYAAYPALAENTIAQFASRPDLISRGDHLWGLLTSTFLHGNLIHLAGNMYFLWLTGDNLEEALGHWRFLALYLLCGIGASAVSLFFNWGSDIPSLGASGAIAGLFAMYGLWFRHASLTFMVIIYQVKLAPMYYMLIWLGLNFLGMLIGEDGVDYWGHIGGFAVGMIIALLLHRWVIEHNPLVRLMSSPHARLVR